MAIGTYQLQGNQYGAPCLEWLDGVFIVNGGFLEHNDGRVVTNFDRLLSTFDTLSWVGTFDNNHSAPYPRHGYLGGGGLLILGGIERLNTEFVDRALEIKRKQIPSNGFYYEDSVTQMCEIPPDGRDTPHIIRGMAYALKTRVNENETTEPVPFIFWVSYDGTTERVGDLTIRTILRGRRTAL